MLFRSHGRLSPVLLSPGIHVSPYRIGHTPTITSCPGRLFSPKCALYLLVTRESSTAKIVLGSAALVVSPRQTQESGRQTVIHPPLGRTGQYMQSMSHPMERKSRTGADVDATCVSSLSTGKRALRPGRLGDRGQVFTKRMPPRHESIHLRQSEWPPSRRRPNPSQSETQPIPRLGER